MNVDEVATAIATFAARHQVTLDRLGTRQTQVLELAAMVGVSQHYVASGFKVVALNPRSAGEFVVKSGTRGHPSDYSRVICSRGNDSVELHANLLVQGAHGEGTYCVDVGITAVDSVPIGKGKDKWVCLSNDQLRSFVEVKKLVVYPMLLAQFLGIVHEIAPSFLVTPKPAGFGPGAHLPPTLVALGHYSSNSRQIVQAFERRGFSFRVVPSFDVRLAVARGDNAASPFYGKLDDEPV